MKQKTIRFYGDSKDDMAAFDRLRHYKEYGFYNEREFIIAAINRYSRQKDERPVEPIDIERLVELIVIKMGERGYQPAEPSTSAKVQDEDKDKELFDKALSFINSL